MQVNVGGDRIGSGAKMQVDLHNYNRSTHNLSKKFQSSLAPGVLYPCYVNVGLNGDKFDIDIESITRTLPTQGPLFGSFKMQIDCFVTPIRLYHGILHNNPINIGLQMKNVIMPKMKIQTETKELDTKKGIMVPNRHQINPSNIWRYLGMSGLGRFSNIQGTRISRKVNALPLLTYYDIFKNYYANKQEDNAYVIKYKDTSYYESSFESVILFYTQNDMYEDTIMEIDQAYTIQYNDTLLFTEAENIWYTDENGKKILNVKIKDNNQNEIDNNLFVYFSDTQVMYKGPSIRILRPETSTIPLGKKQMNLQKFALKNIDKMRELLLSTKLGEEFDVANKANTNNIQYPYTINTMYEPSPLSTLQPLAGLCVKTYQSDMFNNWIKTETISGSNGIAEITRVSTANGLDIDALNLAQKVYNMLNRIAVSGGTYEDWQEAVYTSSTIRKAETPMYMGGYATEIMFEEVISTSQTETEGQKNPLGMLGGRGKEINSKGGHIKFTVEEPSIIMCIASLTPRITYSQGNKWFLTDFDTIDDLHKPALDGIGFQDLIVEQMAWNGTRLDEQGNVAERLSAGKTVAWLNYMTDVNECYGDFASDKAFMVLNRNYDVKLAGNSILAPTDITTYIDPSKFNYAFAYDELQAQNFWTEIQFNITARRLMSAKQIPNL